jgi:hypothetical protein
MPSGGCSAGICQFACMWRDAGGTAAGTDTGTDAGRNAGRDAGRDMGMEVTCEGGTWPDDCVDRDVLAQARTFASTETASGLACFPDCSLPT